MLYDSRVDDSVLFDSLLMTFVSMDNPFTTNHTSVVFLESKPGPSA
jgi:hypothetical protein